MDASEQKAMLINYEHNFSKQWTWTKYFLAKRMLAWRHTSHTKYFELESTFVVDEFIWSRFFFQTYATYSIVTPIILYLTQVSALRRVYGKISNFPKKHTAFHYWQNGNSFNQIAKKLGVAEATAEIYVIDVIADRRTHEACHRAGNTTCSIWTSREEINPEWNNTAANFWGNKPWTIQRNSSNHCSNDQWLRTTSRS